MNLKETTNYATHWELQNSLGSSLSWSVKEILKHLLTNLQETKNTRTVKTNSLYYHHYYYVEVKTASVSLVCMCVLSGSDCVFLRKRMAFSFSSFRMRRPRLDWIWMQNTVGCSVCTSVRVSEFKKLFFLLPHKPFPALAPAASWPLLSGLQTRPPLAASSSSTRSLQEFNHID